LANIGRNARRFYYKYGPFAVLQKIRIKLFNDHRGAWILGRNHELSYWKKALLPESGEWSEGLLHLEYRLDSESELQKELADLVTFSNGETPRILDVGCGPLTSLGKKVGEKSVDLICIDPLAEDYVKIMEEVGLEPLIKPRAIPGEEIHLNFEENSFDLAHARNSLDHAYNPAYVIRQMLWAVRPGGAVYLYHLVNEAERNEYKGLHQWNFCSRNGEFVVGDSNKEINLSEDLGNFAKVSCIEGTEEELDWLVVIIEKTCRFDL